MVQEIEERRHRHGECSGLDVGCESERKGFC
jgi:hypothetical protein